MLKEIEYKDMINYFKDKKIEVISHAYEYEHNVIWGYNIVIPKDKYNLYIANINNDRIKINVEDINANDIVPSTKTPIIFNIILFTDDELSFEITSRNDLHDNIIRIKSIDKMLLDDANNIYFC